MTGWVVFGLAVVVVVGLVVRGRLRPKEAGGYSTPTMMELSRSMQEGFDEVRRANEACQQAHGPAYVVAWRELHAVLARRTAALGDLAGDRPRPRTVRMLRLTIDEIWDVSGRHLTAHTPTTPEDIAIVERGARVRAEALRR